jgi:hypothetical protein
VITPYTNLLTNSSIFYTTPPTEEKSPQTLHRPPSLYRTGGCRALAGFLRGISVDTSAGMVLRVEVALGVVTTLGGASEIDTSFGASNIPLGCASEGIWEFEESSVLTMVGGKSNTGVAEYGGTPG